ncbi:hypothetical protein JCM3774_000277 [Rhodotorula dairenensis]
MRFGLSVTLATLAAATVTAVPSAARKVRVVNKCSYDIYPAVAPFRNLAEPYMGERGWHAAPDTSKDISVPGTFLGRIWARHGCAPPKGDEIYCVTGGCRDNKFACEDGAMGGGATSVEFRLRSVQNGEYDHYDLSNGAGWGVPVGVKPAGEKCDSVVCTPTLATCPDPKLILADSYGQILGCNSACYGGIGDSDQQCCKGAFADGAKCTPDIIQFYEYFKAPCRNAYAYYQDSRQGSPTVNYMCNAEGDPAFTVTFCPEGDGDSAGGSEKGGGASESATATGGKKSKSAGAQSSGGSGEIGQPTGTAAVTQPSDIPAISAVPSLTVTSPGAEGTPQANTTSATSDVSSVSTDAPTPTDASASAVGAEASDSTESSVADETPAGISKPAMIAAGVSIALVAILGAILACVISRRKNSSSGAAATGPASSTPAGGAAGNSDPEAGPRREWHLCLPL